MKMKAQSAINFFPELLARAFDRERMHQAHPAFPSIIRSLADDEILLLRKINVGHVTIVTGYIRAGSLTLRSPTADRPEFGYLTSPSQLLAYARHLEALGLISPLIHENDDGEPSSHTGKYNTFYTLRISDFGKLFADAVLERTL